MPLLRAHRLTLAIALASPACGSPAETPTGEPTPGSAPEQLKSLLYQGYLGKASSLTALQVATGYERNATGMAQRFRGDWLKVLGVVSSVAKDPTPAVVVGSGLGGEDKVFCQPVDPAWANSVTPGQPIVVLGKGTEDAGKLILSECAWEIELEPDVARDLVPEALPETLALEVTEDKKLGTTKRTVHANIGQKLTAGQLRTLAYKLKYDEPAYFAQTRILFKLPTMTEGSWATAILEDELKLTIHGLSLEAQQKLAAAPTPGLPAGAKILGTWFGEGLGGHKLTIYEADGGHHLVREPATGGEPVRRELKEAPSKDGRRFDDIKAENSEHYIVLADGNLQSWDGDGLISTELKG